MNDNDESIVTTKENVTLEMDVEEEGFDFTSSIDTTEAQADCALECFNGTIDSI